VTLGGLLLLLFTANLLTFGSGRTMVPILERALVSESGGLSLDQFLFAFAIGRVTPGPANLYVAAIAYMLHGLPGALLAAGAVVAPGYLIVPLHAGYRRFAGTGAVRGFGRGLTAASVGLLVASSIDIGRSALTSPGAAGVCLFTLLLLHVLRWNPLLCLGAAAAVGVGLSRFLAG
jgi:chromate transporter